MSSSRDHYPLIWAWGRMFGSHDYYMYDQCEAASKDEAPWNAIYKRRKSVSNWDDEEWVILDSSTPLSTLEKVRSHLISRDTRSIEYVDGLIDGAREKLGMDKR